MLALLMKLTVIAVLLMLGSLFCSLYLFFQAKEQGQRVSALEEHLGIEPVELAAQSSANESGAVPVVAEQGDEVTRLLAEREALRQERNALETEKSLLDQKLDEQQPSSDVELSDLQKKIVEAASLAEVLQIEQEYGFVVISAGQGSGVSVGQEFALRREHYLVGKVVVAEVKEGTAVANLVVGSVPVGIEIAAGDQVILEPSS